MNKYTNIVTQPIRQTFSQYVSDDSETIHRKLYSDALRKFKAQYSNLSILYVKEIPNMSYWKASSIVVYFKQNGKLTNKKYDLSPFWNNKYVKQRLKLDGNSDNPIKSIDEESYRSLVIDQVNYVSGIAFVHSEQTGKHFEIPIEYANNFKFAQLSTIDETFTKKRGNN